MFQYNLFPRKNYLLATKEDQKLSRFKFKYLLNSLNEPIRIVCKTELNKINKGTNINQSSYSLITNSDVCENLNNSNLEYIQIECSSANNIRVEEHRKYVVIIENGERYFAKLIKIIQYPQMLLIGFINNLMIPNTEIALTIFPLPQDESIKIVKKRLETTEAIVNWKARKNPNQEFFIEDEIVTKLQKTMIDLMSNEEKLCMMGLYILIKESSLELLETKSKQVSTLLDGMQIRYRYTNCDHFNCFKNFRDYKLIDHIEELKPLLTSVISNFYPFIRYIPEEGIPVGYDYQNHQLIKLNFSKMFNLSWFIFGIAGSGKSFATKSIIKKISQYKKIYILDITGEYANLSSKNIIIISKDFERFLLDTEFKNCLIVIDEAWDILKTDRVIKRVVAIAKGYRKRGVGVFVCTQNLTDMDKEDIELIIKNCANTLILHLTSLELQQISNYMNIPTHIIEYLSNIEKGEGWMTIGTNQYAFKPIFNKEEYDLFNTNYEEMKGVEYGG